MPKYAVDFLAEIQELTSATNFDDCSDSVDLLTSLHLFDVPVERTSEDNNVVTALMGNAQCCFRRYPGYQAHRHVVVSRGVQCSEAIIKKLIENDIDSADNNNLFRFHLTERGDIFNEGFYKDGAKSPDNQSTVPLKISVNPCRNGGIFKRKPEVFTPVTQEPPELRESAKFYHKTFSNEYRKSRKYFEDDIDSLSATISNYSMHEKLLRPEENVICDRPLESMDQNNHKFTNKPSSTHIFPKREMEFRSSTEAIKGSVTVSITGRSLLPCTVKKECLENQSSDSFTSLGNIKENRSTFVTNSEDITPETIPEEIDKRRHNSQGNIANFPNDKVSNSTPPNSGNFIQAFLQQPEKTKPLSTSSDKNVKIEHNNQCSSDKANRSNSASVTFMKGSEELKKYEQKSSESDNINALRKKQRFIMKHTRTNSKINLSGSSLDTPPLLITDPNLQAMTDKNDNHSTRYQKTPELPPAPAELPIPKSPSRTYLPNQANGDTLRSMNPSRTSNHSENACNTPNQIPQKSKRTVSFDRSKQVDKFSTDQLMNAAEPTGQLCSRNTVRAKYCTKKVVKHKFYVPESANIEQILRDPSDRRIKAICDRHNCDIEIYSKVPKCGFLKNIIILAAPNNENLRKCVRSLDYSMHWCLAAQLSC